VHINAGVAGLVGAYCIGKRIGYGKEADGAALADHDHDRRLAAVGGLVRLQRRLGPRSQRRLRALAFLNTFLATAVRALSWCLGEGCIKGKPSMLGAASGAVAGLVAITPAAGNVGIVGGVVLGAIAGFACLWGVTGLKKLLGADDTLDVFGVHGVGGIVGALLVKMTVGSNGMWDQFVIQAKGVGVTIVWSGVVAFIAYKLVDLTIGLRVTEEEEREGLDVSSHGETAYAN
jgi:Amt family ammonium transporter